jgi:hypothetical protein
LVILNKTNSYIHFFFLVLDEVVNPLKLNSHNCEIPGSNPGHDVRPNNFGIFASWARTSRRREYFLNRWQSSQIYYSSHSKLIILFDYCIHVADVQMWPLIFLAMYN